MEREAFRRISREELIQYLHSYRIPIETWGKGESKTLDHLLRELNAGETILVEHGDQVHRIVEGVGLNVYYHDGKDLLRLKEDKQVFSDGRVRERNLSTSIGEKLRPNEPVMECASRNLEEELGIICAEFTSLRVEDRDPVLSTSFPGLWTKNLVFIIEAHLFPSDFKPKGYVEVQEDKTTYFVWEIVDGRI